MRGKWKPILININEGFTINLGRNQQIGIIRDLLVCITLAEINSLFANMEF